MVNHHKLMTKRVVVILLQLLTSVWSIVYAGLQNEQSLVGVSSEEIAICTPTLLPIADYEFEFPRNDTQTNLLLEYFDMLQCTTQQTNLLLLPSFIAAQPTRDTICAGESYEWNGKTYFKPGIYTDTLQNIHSCDSIVTLHLHVNPTYEVHDTIVACDSYTFNPFNKNGGGYNHL